MIMPTSLLVQQWLWEVPPESTSPIFMGVKPSHIFTVSGGQRFKNTWFRGALHQAGMRMCPYPISMSSLMVGSAMMSSMAMLTALAEVSAEKPSYVAFHGASSPSLSQTNGEQASVQGQAEQQHATCLSLTHWVRFWGACGGLFICYYCCHRYHHH